MAFRDLHEQVLEEFAEAAAAVDIEAREAAGFSFLRAVKQERDRVYDSKRRVRDAAKVRSRQARWYLKARTDPEFRKKRTSKALARYYELRDEPTWRAKRLEASRRWSQRIKSDPVKLARRREQQRKSDAKRRRNRRIK